VVYGRGQQRAIRALHGLPILCFAPPTRLLPEAWRYVGGKNVEPPALVLLRPLLSQPSKAGAEDGDHPVVCHHDADLPPLADMDRSTQPIITVLLNLSWRETGMAHSKSADAPNDLRKLFATPSLMKGEDADVYAELYAQVEEVAQPKDVLDEMMVADVVNHFWEQQRYRRCTGTIVNSKRRDALKSILQHGIGLNSCDTDKLLDIYFEITRCGEPRPSSIYPDPAEIPTDRAGVISFLKQHGFDETDIDRLAMERSVNTLSDLENLAFKHEIRREAIFWELELRREKREQRQRSSALYGRVRATAKNLPKASGPVPTEPSL
jgi:hypothetical protein